MRRGVRAGLVLLVACCAALVQVAENATPTKIRPTTSIERMMSRPSSAAVFARRSEAASIAATLADEIGRVQRARHRPPRRPRRRARRRRGCSSRLARGARAARDRGRPRRARRTSPPTPAPSPSRPPARDCAHSEISSARSETAADVTGLRDAHEPVRVQVVAEEERGVAIRRARTAAGGRSGRGSPRRSSRARARGSSGCEWREDRDRAPARPRDAAPRPRAGSRRRRPLRWRRTPRER